MQTKLQAIIASLVISALIIPQSAFANTANDAKITAQIQELVRQESDLPLKNIDISTHDGIVKLNGYLDTTLQANRAVELAYSVEKVQDVDNNIEIRDSEQYIKDSIITARARGKVIQLSREGKISKPYHLHFETTNGDLHVLGEVGNKKDIATLKKALIKLKGVKTVNANVWEMR